MKTEGNTIEQLEWKGMLYDFYGELLTQHQKKIYETTYLKDRCGHTSGKGSPIIMPVYLEVRPMLFYDVN